MRTDEAQHCRMQVTLNTSAQEGLELLLAFCCSTCCLTVAAEPAAERAHPRKNGSAVAWLHTWLLVRKCQRWLVVGRSCTQLPPCKSIRQHTSRLSMSATAVQNGLRITAGCLLPHAQEAQRPQHTAKTSWVGGRSVPPRCCCCFYNAQASKQSL